MLLAVLVSTVLFVATASSAEDLQVPMLKACSEIHNVTMFNVTATSDPGSNMLNVTFFMDVMVTLQKNATLQVTIADEGMTSPIPCIEDVGSCEYMLCGGNSTMEMEITEAWNNTCPIHKKVYQVTMTLDLTKNTHLTSGNEIKIFNYTFEDNGKIAGCVSFEVELPPRSGSSAPSPAAFHVSWIIALSLFLLKCW
ncbi:uncharacterized protein LOC144104409 [Amblyomma americanum]